MSLIIVTGAAGFIGSASCIGLANAGYRVIGLDNLSRPGSAWRSDRLGQSGIEIVQLDIRDRNLVFDFFQNLQKEVSGVLHLAAQTAVTTSYDDPAFDFDTNAIGTFNVVEATRIFCPEAHLVYSSTNKVLGAGPFTSPVPSSRALKPSTPYGLSKAVGDLYLVEYGRDPFRLKTTVLRQSCIYGPGQLGVEDQGWAAWFGLANLLGRPITIFGNGSQIRDMLFIDDLVDLYLRVFEAGTTGAFVVGGGEQNMVSIGNAVDLIEEISGEAFTDVRFGLPRPDDQDYFVADNSSLVEILGWEPQITVGAGLKSLLDWQASNLESIDQILAP